MRIDHPDRFRCGCALGPTRCGCALGPTRCGCALGQHRRTNRPRAIYRLTQTNHWRSVPPFSSLKQTKSSAEQAREANQKSLGEARKPPTATQTAVLGHSQIPSFSKNKIIGKTQDTEPPRATPNDDVAQPDPNTEEKVRRHRSVSLLTSKN